MLNITRSAGTASVKTLIDTAADSDELVSDESEDHTDNSPDDVVVSDNDESLMDNGRRLC